MDLDDLTLSNESVLVRRMRMGRIRQLSVAFLSVLAALICLVTLSPAMVGGTAYYAITILLMINAGIAIKQCTTVLHPIETMLRRMASIENAVDDGKYRINRLYNKADDEFACLAAGMDSLIEKLIEKSQRADERALRNLAVVHATPFTFFTVSSAGKVFAVVKDQYNLVPLLKLRSGHAPTAEEWGATNHATFMRAVKRAFEGGVMQWFDMRFPGDDTQPDHNLRSTVTRINNLSALVVMGDMPAIDQMVEGMSDTSRQSNRTQKHAALRRFAASVAHDARNIFAVLNNLVEINHMSKDADLVEQSEIAADAIRRGTRLMSELMQYAGETQYNLKCMPAYETSAKLFHNPTLLALVPSNIKLIVEVSEEPMPDIDVDPDQAWKVPFNLVKNSVEAIGNNPGRIWLNARAFTMTAEKAKGFRSTSHVPLGKGVMASLVDDGPGIAETMIDRLFDPYYSSKGSGRGLGLATVLSIVEAHNGAIRVTSQPGLGSVFEIFLPASRHDTAELEVVREAAPNGEILLVDDDRAILQTTCLVLKLLKLAAHPAANANDALRKLRTLRERLRAVVIDAHLDGANNLMATIRAEFPKLMVVLSSGTPEDSLQGTVNRKLYDRFLVKPYTTDDLSAALK